MNFARLNQYILFLLLGLTLSSSLPARDISSEQRSASAARKQYDEANSECDAATQRLTEQEKFVVQEQARLKELQDKQRDAKINLEKAKSELDIRDKALNDVWEDRDK
jgi:hypothetical protein